MYDSIKFENSGRRFSYHALSERQNFNFDKVTIVGREFTMTGKEIL